VTSLDAEAPLAQKTAPQLQDVIVASRPNLSDEEIRELEELITEYEDPFASKRSDYGRTDRLYQRIDAREARPIRQPPTRLPLAK
jgi:hypothetical protein